MFTVGLIFGWLAAHASSLQVTYLGHAAFWLETPQHTHILIDPWLKNPKYPQNITLPDHVDAILVTHGHFDHVGEATTLSSEKKAMVVGSFELIENLKLPETVAQGINPGGSLTIKDVTVHAVEAVHSSGMGGVAMGYVVEVAGGPTLYHAGDTDVFTGMSLIAKRFRPTIALLPIGGHFTMDPKGAALAAELLKVNTVVPMHYGTFPVLSGTPEQLRKVLRSSIRMKTIKPGVTTSLMR